MECDGSLRLDDIARRDVMGLFSLAAAPCVSPSLLRAYCTRQSNQNAVHPHRPSSELPAPTVFSDLQSHTTAWQPSQADIDAKPWQYIG